jgi:hypothetical protein
MPRQTRPERLNNPLRQLRGILANPPDNKPLTQAQFAGITDVPLDSVRGIEAGRQAFSSRMQNRIRCETAAAWNEQDQRWRFWKRDGPTYRREHYLKFRELIGRDVEDARRLDIFLAALRIKLLTETLSPEAQFKFNFRLNSFLEKNRKEFCPDQFAELFEDASSYIEAHPELDRDNPLLVFRRYPPRLKAVLGAIPPGAIDWFATKLNPSDYEIVKQQQPQPHMKQQTQPHAKKRRKKRAAASGE